jgi:hypothetical protein
MLKNSMEPHMACASVNYQAKKSSPGCSYTAWEDVDIEGTSELAARKAKKYESDAIAKGMRSNSILKLTGGLT